MRRMQPLLWVVAALALTAFFFAACGPPDKPPLTPDGENPELTSGGGDAGTG